MNSIDFKEIQTSLDWEFFAEAFFRAKGKNIIQGPSTGGDSGRGKDLIIEETLSSEFGDIKRKILVSCKHYAKSGKSVNSDDEKDNILMNLLAENCSGFLGFYSTAVSSPLQSKILDLNKNEKVKIDIADYYDSESIEQFLLFNDVENLLLKRFFPNSFRKWKKLGSKDAEENPNFIKLTEVDYKSENKDYFKKYYEGQPADWSIIRKYTFKRDSFDFIIRQLENNKVCLITGAGGEGKTTLLRQVGDYYFQNGLIVLYAFSSIMNLELDELIFKPEKNYLIIIDNANEVNNLTAFVQKVKLSKNVLLLLASRKNEWDYSFNNRDDKQDLSRWIGKIINLNKLSENEVILLSKLLQKHEVLNLEVKDNLPNFIKNSPNSIFLMAIMIYATQGKSFELIIKDVIDKIRSWKDSKKTIEAIGYIVCIEVLGRGVHGQIYCQETLLKKLLEIHDFEQYQTIKKHLGEEAFFQGSLRNIINTRNPLVAQIYFDYLFGSTSPILDKYDFYYNIIRETSFTNNSYDNDVRSLIPKYLLGIDEQIAIQLVKDSISYGFFWNTYYPFIDIEISKENIGTYNSDEYSARWLFEKAYEKNSKDPRLYQKWANFEVDQGSLGQINTAYTARWILKKGIEIKDDPNIYDTWARIEAKNENIGKLINGEFEEYSARWICLTGVEKTQFPNLYVVWASIEAENENIGKLINGEFEEYSARWIFLNGVEKTHNPNIYVVWAIMEAKEGNIGKLINEEFEKYSARWICSTGIERTHDPNLYVIWASMESKEENIGKLINGEFKEYSARWICRSGIEKTHDPNLYAVWARIEAENENIGKVINGEFEVYSARWILFKGFNKTRDPQVLNSWIMLELNNNNIGTIDIIYSAEWLYSLYKTNFGLRRKKQSAIELKQFLDSTKNTILE